MGTRMRLSLQPNGKVAHTRPHSYLVELPNGATAILDAVDGQGWHVTIRHRGRARDAGVFATTDAALDFLEHEFVLPG